MEPIETITISNTLRLRVYPDDDAGHCNPLDEYDHGIQFVTLPGAGRIYRNYHDPETYNKTYDGVPPLDIPYLESFREFWTGEYGERPEHMSPSFWTWLDTHTAAWITVDRSGYDGAFATHTGTRSLYRDDAIALVSRDVYRRWHGIPDGQRMPKGYRDDATKALRAIIGGYNAWATGDVYGYVVERLIPSCPCCGNPERWESTDDSCWGFIGYDYAMSAFRDIADNYGK
jgi:hypothetical protein